MSAGCDMVILNGQNPDILYDFIEGKHPGTIFKARAKAK